MESKRRRRPAAVAAMLLLAPFGCGGPQVKKPADLESMCSVPAGEFVMGRDTAENDEQPQRSVWLDAFYIDRTEVTNRAFKAFCDATGYLHPSNPLWDGNYFLANPDHPVLNLTWDQARAYCTWAGKRLPTEAEWEKAARGTDGRTYPWGNAWGDSLANMRDGDAFAKAAPVGRFPGGASPYGALDMAGNVWEWCSDWYLLEYYQQAPARNPIGPPGPAPRRVVRGGSFTSGQSDAEVANRDKYTPNHLLDHIGCRCAWSSQPPPTAP
jgi:formylglycine-generating enzyme required for sulfatase activity